MQRFDPVWLNQTKRGKDGVYRFPDFAAESVTTSLDAINKPALMYWAASQEKKAALNAAAELYSDCTKLEAPITRSAFIEAATKRMGAQKAHEKELARTADIGSNIHLYIENYLKKLLGQPTEPMEFTDPEVANGIAEFQSWFEQYELEPLYVEQTVRYDPLEYAGSIDVIGTIILNGEERQAVIDWKSGSGLYFEHVVQNSAYVAAARYCGLVEADCLGVLVKTPRKIGDKPDMKIVTPAQQVKYLAALSAAKQIRALQKLFKEEYE